jgi:hypothetical protein
METLFGMARKVERSGDNIRLHLDRYIQDIIDEYSAFAGKPVGPKQVPSQPGQQAMFRSRAHTMLRAESGRPTRHRRLAISGLAHRVMVDVARGCRAPT